MDPGLNSPVKEIDVHDLILSLPEDNTFNALKKALVQRTIISEQQ